NVGPQSGTANVSIPIEVPPGRGGLTPELALTYDSGRVGDMHRMASTASWAGMGWDLSTGAVRVSPGDDGQHFRAFLDAGSFGGELMPDGTMDGTRYVWRLRGENYTRVRSNCSGSIAPYGHVLGGCTFWVTTKDGRLYTYGGDASHARYTLFLLQGYSGSSSVPDYYQFDLSA